MKSILIRSPRSSDQYSIIKLLISQFRKRENKALDKNDYFKRWSLNFKKMLDLPNIDIYIVEKDNNIIGVTTVYKLKRLELAGEYAVIEDVFIKKNERNQGIGTLLFKKILEDLEQADVKFVTLNVDPKSEPALSFYKKLGFSNIDMEMRKNLNKIF